MPHTEQPCQHAAKPFLKWAGGKSQLLAQLDQHLPERRGCDYRSTIKCGDFATFGNKFILN